MPRTVTLSAPTSKGVAAIVLRDPTTRDLRELGNPFQWVAIGDAGGYVQETHEITAAWIERLADQPPHVIDALPLADGLALSEAIRDFFTAAQRTARTPSPASAAAPDSSSSAGASIPAPSTI